MADGSLYNGDLLVVDSAESRGTAISLSPAYRGVYG
jgi:hypothetical protein